MRRRFSFLSLFVFLFVLSASLVTAAQLVNIGAAKRAAEYHGESIFEKDLKVCDHELLHWAWGEPAVYVFTLMREGDVYPSNILQDSTLLKGAYLVSIGQKEAGYEKMAQADRYWTVYVGATTDMPSFLEAHAGLPEHIVTQPLMKNRPRDPYWIYGDLFHILVTSRSQMGTSDTKATEIHLNKVVALKELGHEKVGTIPAYAEQIEWGRFTNPQAIPLIGEDLYGMNLKGILKGKHQLPVKELNNNGKSWGCSAAAFYNCLKYQEEKKRVKTYGKDASFLQEWISICFEADPLDEWGSTYKTELPGAIKVFSGLNYSSTAGKAFNPKKSSLSFLTKYAEEINNDNPCLIGNGWGIFKKHSTTGIGYWKIGTKYLICIHDGWESTPEPKWIKYGGYPNSQLKDDPVLMEWFHPGAEETFKTAKPVIDGPKIVSFDETTGSWQWDDKLADPNKIIVKAYGYKYALYDEKGVRYWHDERPRFLPYKDKLSWSYKKPFGKTGTVEVEYLLLDANGHLLVAKKTTQLVNGDVYTGPFTGTMTAHLYSTIYNDIWYWKGVFKTTVTVVVSGSGTSSDPYQGYLTIDGSYDETAYWGDDPESKDTVKNGIRGTGIVSGSKGWIVASADAKVVLLDQYSYIGPFVLSIKGTKSAGDTLTGTITLTENTIIPYDFDGPIVKTLKLTKSN